MKVIIQSFFGNLYFPMDVSNLAKEIIKKDGDLWRINKQLIEAIEALPCLSVDNADIKMRDDITQRVKTNDGYEYVFYVADKFALNNIASLEIVNVDEHRPWYVDEHDGKESIEYLDKYKPISKEANFYGRA